MSTVSFEWHGDKAKELIAEGEIEGLQLSSEHVLAESRLLVPYEEGELDRSGATSIDEDARIAAISYNQPYAARQHEELTWQHDEGRQAKYLEMPFIREAPVVREIIAAQIRRKLHGP
jgi:hypothetical protein